MPSVVEEKKQIATLKIQAQRRINSTRKQRVVTLVLSVLCLASAIVSWLNHASPYVVPLTGAAAFLLAISLTRDTSETTAEIASLEGRENTLEALEGLREILKEDANYIEQIGQAALSNISAYFEIVMKKYRQGAVLTHIAAAISFMLIISAVGILYYEPFEHRIAAAAISTGAGIVTQFLTGIFFVMNKTDSQHLDKYQDKLERLTDMALMFGMIERMKTPQDVGKIRSEVIMRIANGRFGSK